MGSSLNYTLLLSLVLVICITQTLAQTTFVPGGCRSCNSDCQKFPRAEGGCDVCVCDGVVLPECPAVNCEIFCAVETSPDGCRMCNCNKSAVICPPIRPCPEECQRIEDDNGCPSCRCSDNNNNNPQDNMNANSSPTCPPVPVCPLGCISTLDFQGVECYNCNCTLVPPRINQFTPGIGRPNNVGQTGFNRPVGGLGQGGVIRRPSGSGQFGIGGSGQGRPNTFGPTPGGPGGLLSNQRQIVCGETECAPECRLCVGRDGCGRCLCGKNANICPGVPSCRQSCISKGPDGCLRCNCPSPGSGPIGFSPFGGFNPFRRPFRPFGINGGGPITLIITSSDGPDFDDTFSTGIVSTPTGTFAGQVPVTGDDDVPNVAVVDPFDPSIADVDPSLAVVAEPIHGVDVPIIDVPVPVDSDNDQLPVVLQPDDSDYFDQGLVEEIPFPNTPGLALPPITTQDREVINGFPAGPGNVNNGPIMPNSVNNNPVRPNNVNNNNPLGANNVNDVPTRPNNINNDPLRPNNNPANLNNLNNNPVRPNNVNNNPTRPNNGNNNPANSNNINDRPVMPNEINNIPREPNNINNNNNLGVPIPSTQQQNPPANAQPTEPEILVPIIPTDDLTDVQVMNIPDVPTDGAPPLVVDGLSPQSQNIPPGSPNEVDVFPIDSLNLNQVSPTTNPNIPIANPNDVFQEGQIVEQVPL